MKAAPKSRRRKTILVAEDESQLAGIIRLSLHEAGYKPVVVGDGIEALNYILEHRPDVVVLDLMLPRLAGYDLCAMIRRSPTVGRTPLVVISGMGTDDSKMRAFEMGVDDYVTKPFVVAELIARIDAVLRRSAQSPPPTPFLVHSAS